MLVQNGDCGSEKSFRKIVKYMLIFAKKSYGSLLRMKASDGVMRVGTWPQAMEKRTSQFMRIRLMVYICEKNVSADKMGVGVCSLCAQEIKVQFYDSEKESENLRKKRLMAYFCGERTLERVEA